MELYSQTDCSWKLTVSVTHSSLSFLNCIMGHNSVSCTFSVWDFPKELYLQHSWHMASYLSFLLNSIPENPTERQINMETKIPYLARSPIFQTEKAFDTDFPVDDVISARKTNHETDERAVKVHDDTKHWDLDVHGFCVLKAHTHLDPHNVFTSKEKVQKAYWYQIEALLHREFPEYTRIESYDCTVSKKPMILEQEIC